MKVFVDNNVRDLGTHHTVHGKHDQPVARIRKCRGALHSGSSLLAASRHATAQLRAAACGM